jgi:hypothetical protein
MLKYTIEIFLRQAPLMIIYSGLSIDTTINLLYDKITVHFVTAPFV